MKAIYQKAFNDQGLHWDKKAGNLLKKHLLDIENSYRHVLLLKNGYA